MSDKPAQDPASLFVASAAERRAAARLAADSKIAERKREIEELSSFERTPAERIEAWERIYELRLPRSPVHPLVSVIAAVTDLSVEQIHAEQYQRERKV